MDISLLVVGIFSPLAFSVRPELIFLMDCQFVLGILVSGWCCDVESRTYGDDCDLQNYHCFAYIFFLLCKLISAAQMRINVGYIDGYYGFIAGWIRDLWTHVENEWNRNKCVRCECKAKVHKVCTQIRGQWGEDLLSFVWYNVHGGNFYQSIGMRQTTVRKYNRIIIRTATTTKMGYRSKTSILQDQDMYLSLQFVVPLRHSK